MSMLLIIQNACDRLGLARPSAVVASGDQQVRQLLALANEEGEALSREFNWQAMRGEQTFTTTATAEQATALPDDFHHFIPGSFFNRTTGRKVLGPLRAAQWQAIQALPAAGVTYLAYRQRAGDFLMTPTPAAGETIAYEYHSTKWARSSGGTAQTAFQADSDETYLDEELIKLGLRWRFKAAKGLDYAEDMRSYELAKEKAKARDQGSDAIVVGGSSRLFAENIPEGNFGL